jgi:hypothetical protein
MQTPNRGKTRTPWRSADLWSEPLYLSVGATFLNGTLSSVAPGPQPSTNGDSMPPAKNSTSRSFTFIVHV